MEQHHEKHIDIASTQSYHKHQNTTVNTKIPKHYGKHDNGKNHNTITAQQHSSTIACTTSQFLIIKKRKTPHKK